jgi:hypothetical protein
LHLFGSDKQEGDNIVIYGQEYDEGGMMVCQNLNDNHINFDDKMSSLWYGLSEESFEEYY